MVEQRVQMQGSGDLGRERGLLIGLHAGDALGSTLEFEPPRAADDFLREIVGGGAFNWEPGASTEDTDMMMCVLESLAACRRLDRADLAQRFLGWYDTNPRDIGLTVQMSLANIKQGLPLEQCGQDHERAQGNGSLMRCAPLALLYRDDEELMRAAFEQASLTHSHAVCGASDYLFLTAVRAAIDGMDRASIFSRVLERANPFDPMLKERLKALPDLPWEELRTTGYVVDTLSAGLWGLLHSESFEDGLLKVVNRGDDADTCGAVCGALCGAYYGVTSIPERWVKLLQRRREIDSLMDGLRSIFP